MIRMNGCNALFDIYIIYVATAVREKAHFCRMLKKNKKKTKLNQTMINGEKSALRRPNGRQKRAENLACGSQTGGGLWNAAVTCLVND